jgi:hypothetical protein
MTRRAAPGRSRHCRGSNSVCRARARERGACGDPRRAAALQGIPGLEALSLFGNQVT